jgi:hypothetical protein
MIIDLIKIHGYTIPLYHSNNLKMNFYFSFLECASLCAINSSCLALNFERAVSTCILGNRTNFRIQANQTLWNEALPVHVKEGIQLETNGK